MTFLDLKMLYLLFVFLDHYKIYAIYDGAFLT
jgi:hypothetical protein